jgi:hypothetical protein
MPLIGPESYSHRLKSRPDVAQSDCPRETNMTRGLLLGGIAIFAFAANAWGAELPAKNANSPEYLATCAFGDMGGLLIPGSGACLNISGYFSGQVEIGNPNKQYMLRIAKAGRSVTSFVSAAAPLRDTIGFTARSQIDFDVRQRTDYGVLRAYAEIQAESGNGFEPSGSSAFINSAYVQWAGLTAGRAPSFFSYLGGGPGWYDFYSPNRVSSNQPNLFAYTATFGGGLSATISLQDAAYSAVDNPISGALDNSYYGEKYHDAIANLRLDQSWGSAQVSGVAHDTHVKGAFGDIADIWGYGLLAGVTVDLPALGAGDRLALQGVYSHAALGYSGIPNTAWSAGDQGLNINDNGTIYQLTDAFNYDVGRWSTPTAWTVAAFFEHHFSAQFSLTPELSFASVRYSNAPTIISISASSFLGGIVGHWDPIADLDIQLGVLVGNTRQAIPSAFAGSVAFSPHSSGVASNLSITRNF